MQGPLHQLLTKYSGRVKLVYINAPLSPRSTRASEIAECAYQQGKFWEYNDLVFENQPVWGRAEDWRKQLFSYGKEAGLDMAALKDCLEKGIGRRALTADIREMEDQAIKFTPTIIMDDGRRFVGSDLEELQSALEGALNLRSGR